jgi:hypothetical protein
MSVSVCLCVCGIVKINLLTIADVQFQILGPEIDMKLEMRSCLLLRIAEAVAAKAVDLCSNLMQYVI